MELFEKNIGIIAFGGYIYSDQKASISLDLDYSYEGQGYAYGEEWETNVEAENWANIGAHVEQIINLKNDVIDVTFKMKITCPVGNTLHFIGFDFDVISKQEFLDTSCAISFYQKTSMHIPYLYYLSSELPIEAHLISKQSFEIGKRVVLKSCNRCGRYLPINIDDELKTLSFSLHCKKRAPCMK